MRKKTDNANDDQVERNDIVQQSRSDQYDDAGDQGDEWSDGDFGILCVRKLQAQNRSLFEYNDSVGNGPGPFNLYSNWQTTV
jgi:hypothetical protein